jgi:NADH-quinone oxidoreductase subunit J
MIEMLFLYLFAGTALAAAVLMIVLRHPMRVALALIACMMSLAAIYALLDVHVIAVFQILIYVGAVMVFMVYAIMLLETRGPSDTRRFSRLVVPAIAGLLLLLAVLVADVWRVLPAPTAAAAGKPFGLKDFSVAFLNDFWLHFELVSILLVAAVVAALAVLQVGRRKHG